MVEKKDTEKEFKNGLKRVHAILRKLSVEIDFELMRVYHNGKLNGLKEAQKIIIKKGDKYGR